MRTAQGWSYLTTIIYLADRMVIGWAMDSSIEHGLYTLSSGPEGVKEKSSYR